MDAKTPGEDYMGDVYEGYIPGALDELHSDGILPLLQIYLPLTRSNHTQHPSKSRMDLVNAT